MDSCYGSLSRFLGLRVSLGIKMRDGAASRVSLGSRNSLRCAGQAGEPFGRAGNFPDVVLVDLVLKVFGGNANSACDGALARRSMSLEHDTVEAQQRGAAVNFRIHPAADRPESIFGEKCPELSLGVGGELTLEHGEHGQRQ